MVNHLLGRARAVDGQVARVDLVSMDIGDDLLEKGALDQPPLCDGAAAIGEGRGRDEGRAVASRVVEREEVAGLFDALHDLGRILRPRQAVGVVVLVEGIDDDVGRARVLVLGPS